MAEGGALRQLFASFVFSFDSGTLQKANSLTDATKGKVVGAGNAFTTMAVNARSRIASVVGSISGWSAAMNQAQASAKGAASGGAALFSGLSSMAAKYVGAFAVLKLKSFADDQLESGEQLFRLSKRIGIGFEDLQRIGKFLAPAGLQINNLQRPFVTLSRNLTKASQSAKGPAAEAFKDLGIEIAKGAPPKALDTFYEIAAALGEMEDDTKRVATAQKLFGMQGAAMLPAFEKDRAGVERMRKEIEESGVAMSKEFGEMSEKIGLANRKMAGAFKALKIQAVSFFLPAWQAISTGMFKAVKATIGFIKTTQLLQVVVGYFAIQFLKGKLLFWTARVIVAFGGLRGALVALNAASGMFLLKWAGLAFLVLLVEDFLVMLKGGPSVIRDFLDEFLGIDNAKAQIEMLRAAWDRFGGSVKAVGGSIVSVLSGDIMGALGLLGMAFAKNESDFDKWSAAFMRAAKPVEAFVDKLLDWFTKLDLFKGEIAKFRNMGKDGVQGGGAQPMTPEEYDRYIANQPEPAYGIRAPAPGAPAAPRTTAAPAGKTLTIVDQRHLSVTTSGAPAEVAKTKDTFSSILDKDRRDTATALGVP